MPSTKMMFFALFCLAVASIVCDATVVPTIPGPGSTKTDLSSAVNSTCQKCVNALGSGGYSNLISIVLDIKASINLWLSGLPSTIDLAVLLQIIILLVIYLAGCINIVIGGVNIAVSLGNLYNTCKTGFDLIVAASVLVNLSVYVQALLTICLNLKANLLLALGL
ncbi:uncharacterized protein LOC125501439 [Athalia rosae]|uniref:uncharacterized protein LOC125501439 n=1 Tax=Athalia rosae TaxID=37344 RepID=UPI0020343EF7|nr:uncharacterized protein LOC125501439 [Athalia rosae]